MELGDKNVRVEEFQVEGEFVESVTDWFDQNVAGVLHAQTAADASGEQTVLAQEENTVQGVGKNSEPDGSVGVENSAGVENSGAVENSDSAQGSG